MPFFSLDNESLNLKKSARKLLTWRNIKLAARKQPCACKHKNLVMSQKMDYALQCKQGEECRLGCYACDSCKNRVSEESIASIIRVIRIGELGTTLAVTSNRHTLRRNIAVGCQLRLKFLAHRFLSP
jgi:hypothetical protein